MHVPPVDAGGEEVGVGVPVGVPDADTPSVVGVDEGVGDGDAPRVADDDGVTPRLALCDADTPRLADDDGLLAVDAAGAGGVTPSGYTRHTVVGAPDGR